jgi:epoxyqueuosine reductase
MAGKGMQGKMQYMENYFELRIDPSKLVPGAKSVVTLLKNYYPSRTQNEKAPKIAKYAYGKDYHDVMRSQLNELMELIRQNMVKYTEEAL